jgi:ribose transport system substrate-binding protein
MLTHIHRRRVSAVLTVLAAAAALTLTACSSSSSSTTSTTSTAASGSSSPGNSEVANAEAFLKPYETPPTSLSLTTPLPHKAATGKTLVWMQCDAAQCAEETTMFRQATAAVGWNLKVINYQTANPATLVSGLQQALQDKPTAVSLVGLPYAVWSSVVPAYKSAGVAIIPMYVGDVPLNSTIVANIATPSDYAVWGKLLANWFISDSGASGKALLVNVTGLAPSPVIVSAFQQTVKSGCAKCSVTTFDQTFADVQAGSLPSAVVSELQRNPDIKYVISAEQPLSAGVSQAISADGLSDIKLAGTSGEQTEESQVKSGVLSAVTPTALNFATWLVVDAALRFSEGAPQPTGTPLPTVLITKSSSITPSDTFAYPADWQEQFKTLWKVG